MIKPLKYGENIQKVPKSYEKPWTRSHLVTPREFPLFWLDIRVFSFQGSPLKSLDDSQVSLFIGWLFAQALARSQSRSSSGRGRGRGWGPGAIPEGILRLFIGLNKPRDTCDVTGSRHQFIFYFDIWIPITNLYDEVLIRDHSSNWFLKG